MKRACAAALLACLCVTASAQSIYKCKGADGRITYSGTPCPGEGDAFSVKGQARSATSAASPSPAAREPQAEGDSKASPSVRAPLPKTCDNAGALKVVVVRLDSPATPDDVRGFLAEERFRLLRCEYTRLTPEERRDKDVLMRDTADPDPARRRAAMARIEGLYDQYLTPAERTARARERQR